MFNTSSAMTPLELAQQVATVLRDARSGSLIEYTRGTRVEPLTLVDMRSAQLPYIEDVLSTALNMVCGYYLQAIHLSANINNVNVMRLLDKLNPNRDPLDAASNSKYLGMLSADGGGVLNFGNAKSTYTQESNTPKNNSGHMIEELNANSNLSIGKLIEIVLGNEKENTMARFPVSVRLMVNTMFPDPLTSVMAMGSHSVTLKERYHNLRSGQIRFIKDFLLCQDLIDEHRNNLINDTSGVYRKRAKQNSKNKLSAILSGQLSVASASSIIVCNDDTMKQAEAKGRFRMSNFNSRSKFFENNHAMICVVIDPSWENATFYFRSIEDTTTARISDMQRLNKSKNGPNILEMLSALRDVRAPSI